MSAACEPTQSPHQDRKALVDDMQTKYGPLVGGFTLAKLLGLPSADALRQARKRGTLPVRVFKVEKRRHWFALTEDVAAWLSGLRHQTPSPLPTQERSVPAETN